MFRYRVITTIDITETDDCDDICQKNFEVLQQAISLRSVPISTGSPYFIEDLRLFGARYIKRSGFVWEFDNEYECVYSINNDMVGLLINELDGIVMPSGEVLRPNKNIEFQYIGVKNAVD